jgi:hypothetical protein
MMLAFCIFYILIPVLIAVFWMLGQVLHFAHPILEIPLIPVICLLGFVIGPEMAIAALYLEISAEITPPGRWTVIQLKPNSVGIVGENSSMRHSFVHEAPEAVHIVCDWISARQKT